MRDYDRSANNYLYLLAAATCLILTVLWFTGCTQEVSQSLADGSTRPLTGAEKASYDLSWKNIYAVVRHARNQCADGHGEPNQLAWSIDADSGALYGFAFNCRNGFTEHHGIMEGSEEISQYDDPSGSYTYAQMLDGPYDMSGGAEMCVGYNPNNVCNPPRKAKP